MRSAMDVAVVIVAIIVVTCAHTSSAAQGRCSRQVMRARYVCDTYRQTYTSSYAAWCPYRHIYYRGQRTGYRTQQNCRRQNYAATEYFCCNGYTTRGRECIVANECSSSPCVNGATCIDGVNSYTCVCVAGFQGTRCQTDVNECSSSPCVNGATCSNDRVNGYTCVCQDGFEGQHCEIDVDECDIGLDNCHADAECINMLGCFTCACKQGYEDLSNDVQNPGRNCTDLDECESELHDCPQEAYCTNTVGGFNCSCHHGFFDTNSSDPGYSCIDIDECSLGLSDCHPNATCDNLYGSYNCSCDAGYRDNGADAANTGRSCSDIDECAEELSRCVYGSCENTDGGYNCICMSRGDLLLYTGEYCDQPTGDFVE